MKSVLIIYKGDVSCEELNSPMRPRNKKMSQNTLGRKSYDRLPNTGPQYFKNSTASETLHMSFIKRPAELEYLEPLNFRQGSS